jgi:hypothetical protein
VFIIGGNERLLFLIATDYWINEMSRTIIKKEDMLSSFSVRRYFSKIIHAVIIVTFFHFLDSME